MPLRDHASFGAAFGRMLLRGVGQVYLLPSARAGVVLLGAVAWQSWTLAGACLLGALAGTAWGLSVGDAAGSRAGLDGYNGALTGLGIMAVLAPGPLAWSLVAPLACLAAWFAHAWRGRCAVPPYTAPFVLVTWLLMAAAAGLGLPRAAVAVAADPGWNGAAQGLLRGVGQVMFLDDPRAGALCLLGLALGAPRAALSAGLASGLCLLAASWAGFPADAARMGLYGFNAVLAAEALRTVRPGRWLLPCLGALLSLGLMRGFQALELPPLTAPFLLATWTVRQAALRRAPQARAA
ncbi:Urea transporter OS=Castellaniella defragrans OX=75697 GN=HNR28_002847 PE=3 SV=1 [Castellaniella denitrificans]|uniref:urea transporter n=1 Tax=Castellaniella sp. TaxID=1955812 RepID=UPI002AFFE87E|nr:urea transporter [Castellaniella sp.]